jgi:hypothetical protein
MLQLRGWSRDKLKCTRFTFILFFFRLKIVYVYIKNKVFIKNFSFSTKNSLLCGFKNHL